MGGETVDPLDSVPVPKLVPSAKNSTPAVGVRCVPVRVATNWTGWPKTDGVTVDVTALVAAIWPTDWLRASEVLAVKSSVPWYVAVTGWSPTPRVEVTSETAAWLARVTGLPNADPSTKNCTVPVGVPAPGATGATLAVKLTGRPHDEGVT